MGMMMSPRGKGKRYKPVAEINVTPFVDVMLVLLIIFMVTAPLLAVGVPVDLPKTKASQISSEEPPLVISIQNSYWFGPISRGHADGCDRKSQNRLL